MFPASAATSRSDPDSLGSGEGRKGWQRHVVVEEAVFILRLLWKTQPSHHTTQHRLFLSHDRTKEKKRKRDSRAGSWLLPGCSLNLLGFRSSLLPHLECSWHR